MALLVIGIGIGIGLGMSMCIGNGMNISNRPRSWRPRKLTSSQSQPEHRVPIRGAHGMVSAMPTKWCLRCGKLGRMVHLGVGIGMGIEMNVSKRP